MSCITRGRKPLQSHQKKFVEAFIRSKLRGAIAIHGAGSGKTLLAVTTSKCYLNKYPDHTVIVITPASLLTGFKKELSEYDSSKNPRYRFYTYAGYVRNPCDCEDSLIIVDEAQNLKNAEGAAFKAVINCAKEANKVLLLSATPIINSPYDLEPLMSLIHGKTPTDESTFNEIINHKKLSQVYFGCRLSFFENDPVRAKKYFPSTKEVFVPIVMDAGTSKLYQNLEKDKSTKDIANIFDLDEKDKKDLQSFFNGLRRVSSSSTQKINYMINFIKQITRTKKPNAKLGITQKMINKHTDKFIIFTHFKTHGSDLIIKQLKKEGISYGFIDGTVPKKKRAKVVDEYVAGKTKVILISAAGATGLNLLETGYMFLVEPSWNESEVIQVMARANRYLSHAKLPPAKRNVRIMKLMLIKQHESRNFDKLVCDKVKYESSNNNASIDIKMVVDSIRKQRVIVESLKFLESKITSLEKCRSKPQDLNIGKLYEMKKLDSVPRITVKESQALTAKPSPKLAKPQTNSHRTLKKETLNNNRCIIEHLLAITGVSKIKHPTTVLFNVTSHVLVYNFLASNTNIYSHVIAKRLSAGTAKKVRQLPRTRVVNAIKKYRIGVFNGYIDFETNTVSKMSTIMAQKLLKNIHSVSDITVALISWSFYKSTTFNTWLSSKNYKAIRYVSPFYMMSNELRTVPKKDAEMVILKIY